MAVLDLGGFISNASRINQFLHHAARDANKEGGMQTTIAVGLLTSLGGDLISLDERANSCPATST
ncbi:hypothetical protein A2U01_0115179 [Trifolium medium]|uniref:Uncharacterized protein n=1 Tax=Trifolium medium TaxID=97028 RepID=A0A392W3W0_9FABA|nr:hypothetical protein [Trifolium medium]